MDSLSLFLTDVKTSYKSAKSNYDCANTLAQTADTLKDPVLKSKYYNMSISYALKAYKIHPVYADNLLTLGNVYYQHKKNYDSTLYWYKKMLQGFPDDWRPCNNIVHFFYNYDNTDYKIRAYKELLALSPNNFDLNNNLGYLYGKFKNNLDSGIYYMNKAIRINNSSPNLNPNIADTYNNLGTWLYMKGDFANAKEYYIKAMDIKPDNPLFVTNLGITYKALGQLDKANEYFARANQLQPKK
jgi:tetratricopeptide (TPR) repeat protein